MKNKNLKKSHPRIEVLVCKYPLGMSIWSGSMFHEEVSVWNTNKNFKYNFMLNKYVANFNSPTLNKKCQ